MDYLWYAWFKIYNELEQKPRAWWMREDVWIPLILCESVFEHCSNVKRWCIVTVEWRPEIIKIPARFIDAWKYHDILEYDMPDITPHCWISDEEKKEMEYKVLERLRVILWPEWEYIIWLLEEYIEGKTPDSKLLNLLDKIDAWVKAFEYEKLWFRKQVAKFHPYILERLNQNPYLDNIYRILLEREFYNVNYHFQYFLLLSLAWDYDEFRNRMSELVK